MEFLWTSKPQQWDLFMAKSLLCPVYVCVCAHMHACMQGRGIPRAHCVQCLFFIVAVISSLVPAADINYLCVETRQACVPISLSPHSEHSSKHAT